MKTGSSWLTRCIVGAVALVLLTPLVLAAVESLLVPAAIVIAVVIGLRVLWSWRAL